MEGSSVFLIKMEELVKQIVSFYNVPCYLVDSKIETHANAYGETFRVPVVRIVGFFEDTIPKVTQVLNSEFELLQIKDTAAGADNFTSTSKTFQAGLKQNRLDLPEYKILSPKKFEIRVSSILQDVYTAMQKGLSSGGSVESVPAHVKRDFYRVGAFLEMADIEFLKIRDNAQNKGGVSQPAVVAQLPEIQQVARTTQVVEPVVQAAPVQPIPVPEVAIPQTVAAPQPVAIPQPVAASVEIPAPAAPVTEQIKITTSENDANKIQAIDMNVDSFNSLAVSINGIENKNGAGTDSYLDMITAPRQENAATQPESLVKAEENPALVPNVASNAPKAPEAVALNIDNIETFNMNVSGMIERTTEIIRESGDKNSGHAVEDHSDKTPANMDENSQMTEAMLKEYVKSSQLVKDVDSQIAERAAAKINDEVDIEGDVERLRFLKVFTLKQLNERIADNKDDIVAFAEKWIGKDNGGSFDSGICLFYLEYLLVGKKNDPAFAVEYVLKFISDNDYSARYIIPTYNSIRQTNEPSNFAHLTLK